MVGSVRFSNNVWTRLDPDVSRWPGVYVHPGKFLSAADRPKEPDAWMRYRDRFQRLKTHVREKRAQKARTPLAGKRRWLRRTKSSQE